MLDAYEEHRTAKVQSRLTRHLSRITTLQPRVYPSGIGFIHRDPSIARVLHHGTMSGDDRTALERQFLIEHGGLTAADLTPEAMAETNAAVERAITSAAAQVQATALTLSEVSTLIGKSRAVILQVVAAGDMYSVPSESPSVETLFPRWQFRDRSVVPHLKEVLAALPAGDHPLDIEQFMTQGNPDYLGGRPPVLWLIEGRELRPVLRYVDDLSWI